MFVENPDNEEKNKTNQSNNLSVGTGGGASGIGSPGTTGNPSSITPVQSNQPRQEFASIQDYFKSNQQQGEDLGQRVASNLDTSATNERNAISNAATGALNEVNANPISYNADLAQRALTNPTEVANSPDQYDAFMKQWNASYKGPSSFENSASYAPAAQAANEANQKAETLKTTGGRQQYLQDEFNVYGQGNKGLDEALLQQSSYFPAIQEKAKGFKTIQDYLAQRSGEVGEQAQTARTNAETAKANTQGTFTNNLSNFQNKINRNVEANREYARNHPTGTTSKMLNPEVDINASNIASPEDYANAAAYQKLTGVNYGGVLNPANVENAGTQNKLHQLQAELDLIKQSGASPETLRDVTNLYNQELNKIRQAGGYSDGGVVEQKDLRTYLKRKKE